MGLLCYDTARRRRRRRPPPPSSAAAAAGNGVVPIYSLCALVYLFIFHTHANTHHRAPSDSTGLTHTSVHQSTLHGPSSLTSHARIRTHTCERSTPRISSRLRAGGSLETVSPGLNFHMTVRYGGKNERDPQFMTRHPTLHPSKKNMPCHF